MHIRHQLMARPCHTLPRSSRRTLTTTSALRKDLGSHLPENVMPSGLQVPPYPYPESTVFKQSNRGLYGGQVIQFGNNVSPDTETKTRRSWTPNIHSKNLYSIALKKKIHLRVTNKVLRTIDKEGGLDEYLLGDSEERIQELGPVGWALRFAVMKSSEGRERMRRQARELGLDQNTIDARWPSDWAYHVQREAEVKQLQATLDENLRKQQLAIERLGLNKEKIRNRLLKQQAVEGGHLGEDDLEKAVKSRLNGTSVAKNLRLLRQKTTKIQSRIGLHNGLTRLVKEDLGKFSINSPEGQAVRHKIRVIKTELGNRAKQSHDTTHTRKSARSRTGKSEAQKDLTSEDAETGEELAEAISEPNEPKNIPLNKAEWVDIAEEERSKIAAEEEARRAVESERNKIWVQK